MLNIMCDDCAYVPQQLIMTEKDAMGKYMYRTCVAAILLLKIYPRYVKSEL